MNSTSCRAIAIALLAACAPVSLKPMAASQPASQPAGKTFNPVNPKDPTQGYFVPYAAAQALLKREYTREQAAGLAKIDCDERVKLVEDSQPMSQWDAWIKPTVVGVGAFILGVAAGVTIESIKK